MKKLLLLIAAFGFFGVLFMPLTAEAVFLEISDPIFSVVYSPDATVVPPYLGDPTTWVNLGPSGSVTIGQPTAEGDPQPVGVYGVGLSLAPLGDVFGYNLAFDRNFATYDSSEYDLFLALITEGDYLWNGADVVGGFSWGGASEGGIEFNVGGWGNQATVLVEPGSEYYLSVVLATSVDTAYPSWGTFSDVSVEGIVPEPASMLLLGMGILGLFGLRRKT